MSEVFVSYSRADSAAAERLTRAIESRGIRVFKDRDALVVGEEWVSQLRDALGRAPVIVLMLSKEAQHQRWVNDEIVSVLARPDAPIVVPVLLDNAAKDNWVWPLVAKWRSYSYDGGRAADSIAEQVANLASIATSRVTPTRSKRKAKRTKSTGHPRAEKDARRDFLDGRRDERELPAPATVRSAPRSAFAAYVFVAIGIAVVVATKLALARQHENGVLSIELIATVVSAGLGVLAGYVHARRRD